MSMERPRALVGPDRQHHAAQGGLGVAGRAPVGVERIAEGNFLAAAFGASDLAARGHRRRHIEKEGRVAARRRAGRERIGAEHAVRAPQGGMAGDALLNTSEINPASSAWRT